VVGHKADTIAIAGHVVDVGLGAGAGGGEIRFEGSADKFKDSDTVSDLHFNDRAPSYESVRAPHGTLVNRKADRNNLNNVDVDIPLGVFTAISGVAGSGKSSLIHEIPRDESVVFVDQTAIHGSNRSNPATYTGMLDSIRKAFAKAN